MMPYLHPNSVHDKIRTNFENSMCLFSPKIFMLFGTVHLFLSKLRSEGQSCPNRCPVVEPTSYKRR